jgi:hypothetical protein
MGSICSRCSTDIINAQNQPLFEFYQVFWILAETFFRRGRGESVTFEKVWSEYSTGNRMLKIDELFNERKGNKNETGN